jgi:hypothetical protein
MDIKEAERLALGEPTACPICGQKVSKPTRSDKDLSNSIVCENEYYVHYTDRSGNHILQQYINPRVNEDRFRYS